jgi:signal transduction histidine kinase
LAAANKGEVRLQVGHDSGGGWVLVCDTGTGIAAEHLPHIFDEYYSTREVGSGNGLGLPFCRRVLRRFGATISVTSVLGEFTEFRLSFPPLAGGSCP